MSKRSKDKEVLASLNTDLNTLFVAADVSAREWKLAASGRSSRRPTESSVTAFEVEALYTWLAEVRERHDLGPGPTVFCYEAGRDGFSIGRVLEQRGIHCLVVDPGSIETSSKSRVAKTDRLDAKKLLLKLRNYISGDAGVFAVVEVPPADVEDRRRLVRERKRLSDERTSHRTRLSSLFGLVGLYLTVDQHLVARLNQLQTAWGEPMPPQIKAEILRELERLELVESQLAQLEQQLKESTRKPVTEADKQGARIKQLRGIGEVTATMLPREFFWRGFNNRKEVGAAAGLDGTPRATGHTLNQDQGISKAGNKRVRGLMIELAWDWIRYQPNSPITTWFYAYTDGTKRSRRKAIVGVARRLLIALWRFGVHGVTPEGAVFKAA
jgi:transposase